MDSERALRQRNRELSVLNAIAEALNGEVDLEQALKTALSLVADLCDLETGWIWLLHEETGEPYLAVVLNLPETLTETPDIMDGREYCYCLDDYQHGGLDGAENISVMTCSRLKGRIIASGGLRCHATVALNAGGKQLGLLNVASAQWDRLTDDELNLLHTVGDLISIAIERARLSEHKTRLAILEERNRLAREIHDTLAQGLAAISLQLETADAMIEGHGDLQAVRSILHKSLSLTRDNLEAARRSVLDLRAAPLDGRTLAEALQLLVERHRKNAAFKIVYEANEKRPLPSAIEAGLYRVAQEALNNIAKHAHPHEVIIKLRTDMDSVELTIEDDGVGFEANVNTNHDTQARFGIIGMNERIHLLGGEMQLCSTPGDGTQIYVTVPIGNDVK